MTYDEVLAERIRIVIKGKRGFSEKKMFGGLSFLLHGNMCCGVIRKNLVVRVGSDQYRKALSSPHTRPMDFTGKPLRGYVYVRPAGYRTGRSLQKWVNQGIVFTSTLKRKAKK